MPGSTAPHSPWYCARPVPAAQYDPWSMPWEETHPDSTHRCPGQFYYATTASYARLLLWLFRGRYGVDLCECQPNLPRECLCPETLKSPTAVVRYRQRTFGHTASTAHRAHRTPYQEHTQGPFILQQNPRMRRDKHCWGDTACGIVLAYILGIWAQPGTYQERLRSPQACDPRFRKECQ